MCSFRRISAGCSPIFSVSAEESATSKRAEIGRWLAWPVTRVLRTPARPPGIHPPRPGVAAAASGRCSPRARARRSTADLGSSRALRTRAIRGTARRSAPGRLGARRRDLRRLRVLGDHLRITGKLIEEMQSWQGRPRSPVPARVSAPPGPPGRRSRAGARRWAVLALSRTAPIWPYRCDGPGGGLLPPTRISRAARRPTGPERIRHHLGDRRDRTLCVEWGQ